MKKKDKYVLAGASGLLFIGLIVLIRFIDVAQIGPVGTSIGLSHLNQFVFELFGVNMLWYEITDWLGIVAIMVAFIFALAGFIQMIKRRSLIKVDREILALGGLYIAVIGLYILFEIAIVNYRPIIMPGSLYPEASFPSSHTMLVCVIIGSAMMLLKSYVKKPTLRKLLWMLGAAVIGVTVIGRMISGVHWFTDIIGGLLISTALLALFSGVTGDKYGGI